MARALGRMELERAAMAAAAPLPEPPPEMDRARVAGRLEFGSHNEEEMVGRAGGADASAPLPPSAPSMAPLEPTQARAVMDGMQGFGLGYVPPWAAAGGAAALDKRIAAMTAAARAAR